MRAATLPTAGLTAIRALAAGGMARDAATFATAIEHLTPRGTVVNNRDPVRRRDHHIPGQQIRPLTRRQGRPAGALVTIAA